MTKKIYGVLILFFLGSCTTAPIPPQPPTPPQENRGETVDSWKKNMLGLSETLSRLLPYVYAPQAFLSPDNERIVGEGIISLTQMSHTIGSMSSPSDRDPILKAVSREFSKDLEFASEEFKLGHKKNARIVLRNSTNYCIACHTRMDRGAQDLTLNLPADISFFTPLERARYFAAIRSFSRSVEEFRLSLADPMSAQRDPLGWMEGAKLSIAIAVRVQKDPVIAENIVGQILASNSLPLLFKQEATEWRKAIREWRNEVNPLKSDSSFAQAQALWNQAQKARNSGWIGAGFIHDLRASNILHQLTASPELSPKLGAQPLLLAGMVAESLSDAGLGELPEPYYENCIRLHPKTEFARTCYLRIERLAMQTYLEGFLEGQSLPRHVQDRLNDLRAQLGEWKLQ